MIVVGVDPAIRSPGWAVVFNGAVVAAGVVRVPAALKSTKLEIGERVRRVGELVADQVLDAAELVAGASSATISVVAYEWPQVYARDKRGGDPNDLLKLAGVGADVAARLSVRRQVGAVRSPTPREWSGGSKKATTGDPWASQRGAMVARRLSAAERARVPDSHDAIDAVAIALWALGRFEPRRVNPGATPG